MVRKFKIDKQPGHGTEIKYYVHPEYPEYDNPISAILDFNDFCSCLFVTKDGSVGGNRWGLG